MAAEFKREWTNFPGKAKFVVWKYFGFWKIIKQDAPSEIMKDKAVCKLCKAEYKYSGNTTNLSQHLSKVHPDELKQNSPATLQPTLQQMFNRNEDTSKSLPLPSKRSGEITRYIAEYIIHDMCPISTVDGIGFRRLINSMEPRYTIPSRKHFTETVFLKMYDVAKSNLQSEINQIENIAITHDMWTSANTESYGTTTCHYITDTWEMKGVVLETKKMDGHHSSENISQELESTRKAWNLPQPVAVSDNAANETKAFQILNWERVSCIGHNLNLAVRDALSIPEISKIVAKGRKVVAYFHRSPLATGILKEKQKLLLPPEFQGHKLIQDVVTRWNSTLDMLERLMEQAPALHAAFMKPSVKKAIDIKMLLSFEEQELIEKVVKLLEPFKCATIILSSESEPTLPAAMPLLKKMEGLLIETETDTTVIKKMKKVTRENIRRRYERNQSENECMPVLPLASILHPRFKDMNFLDEDDRNAAIELLKANALATANNNSLHTTIREEPQGNSEAQYVIPNFTQTDSETEQVDFVKHEENSMPPNKKPRLNMDWFDDVVLVATAGPKFTKAEIVENEVTRYVSEPSSTVDPLTWWRERAPTYPIISRLAKKYLAIPASSVPSERIFSLAGNIVTKKRANLKPENVDRLIFLHKNFHYCAK